jgi:hypothetical protein
MKRLLLVAVLLIVVSPAVADSIQVQVTNLTPHGELDYLLDANSNPLITNYALQGGELLIGATFFTCAGWNVHYNNGPIPSGSNCGYGV